MFDWKTRECVQEAGAYIGRCYASGYGDRDLGLTILQMKTISGQQT